jgi:hypothetical protein
MWLGDYPRQNKNHVNVELTQGVHTAMHLQLCDVSNLMRVSFQAPQGAERR